MMFISRIEIPWDDARNPYDLHRRIWELFPGEEQEARAGWDEARQGFLFRVEHYATGRPVRVLVQSRRAPEPAAGIVLLGSRTFNPQPEVGQQLAFILTANPVKTIDDAERESKPGKRSAKARVPLLKDEARREWLGRKLAGAATVESVAILDMAPVYFRKGGRAGKIVPIAYEGLLRVEEGGRLRHLLQSGVGPAKAFGCGLLLVRRP